VLESPDYTRGTKVDAAVTILDAVLEGMRGPELLAAKPVKGIDDDYMDRSLGGRPVSRDRAQWYMARCFNHKHPRDSGALRTPDGSKI
jgi:hypothetical protein